MLIVPCAIAGGVALVMAVVTWNAIHRKGQALMQEDYLVDKGYLSGEQGWAILAALLSAGMLIAVLGLAALREWGAGLFAATSICTAVVMLVAFSVLAKRRRWQIEGAVAEYDATTWGSMPSEDSKAHSYAPGSQGPPPTASPTIKALSVIRRNPSVSNASAGGMPIAFHSDYPVVDRPVPEFVPYMDDEDDPESQERETRFALPDFAEDSSAL